MFIPTFTQARTLFVKLGVALLIESCGSWSHINCKTFFCSLVLFGLGWNVFQCCFSAVWLFTAGIWDVMSALWLVWRFKKCNAIWPTTAATVCLTFVERTVISRNTCVHCTTLCLKKNPGISDMFKQLQWIQSNISNFCYIELSFNLHLLTISGWTFGYLKNRVPNGYWNGYLSTRFSNQYWHLLLWNACCGDMCCKNREPAEFFH